MISSTSPNPVPSYNGQQTFTINGTGFDPACAVTLRDLRTGQTYPNRNKISQTNTSITLKPNFGTAPGEWSVEVINPGGLSSGQFRFQVGQPAVPGETLSSFEIIDVAPTRADGTSTVNAVAPSNVEQVFSFRAIATYLDGSQADFTNSCKWDVAGDPKAAADGGRLRIFPGVTASSLNLSAHFPGGEAGLTARRVIPVTPSLVVDAMAQLGEFLETEVTLTANSWGPNGPAISYSWTVNNDPIDSTGTGQQVKRIFAPGAQYLIGVEGVDSQGLRDSYYFYLSLERSSAFEPTTSTAVAAKRGAVIASDHSVAVLDDPARRNRGLLVVIHGLWDSEHGSCKKTASGAKVCDEWPAEMANAIEAALVNDPPYVLLYDWSEMSDPTHFRTGGRIWGSSQWKVAQLDDYELIRPYGLAHGKVLADIIEDYAEIGLIDRSKSVHLIGHSAGGFVAGECGKALKRAGYANVQATMLDTPAPASEHFVDRSNGCRLERYIANRYSGAPPPYPPDWYSLVEKIDFYNRRFEYHVPVFQSAASGSTSASAPYYETRFRIFPDGYYHRFVLDLISNDHVQQHDYAHSWYIDSASSSMSGGGFEYSPFMRTAPFPASPSRGFQAGLLASGSMSENAPTSSASTPLSGFSTFGEVSESSGVFTLTEQENSGIYVDTTLPPEVSAFVFSYRWTTLGDGDFLSVHWNEEPPLAMIPAVGMDAGVFVETEVPLEGFAGQTGRLTVKLVSRNDANAVIELTGFSLRTSEDPDGDGLSAEDEANFGTDPMKPDTDGDGLNDDYEALTAFTNPLAADTDGDGMSDAKELAGGTNPLSSASLLRISNFQFHPDGSVLLTWPSVSGKNYRIVRAADVTRLDYLTIESGISASAPTNTFIDTPPADASKAFYWIEVEPF